jgi:hypothetical protein
MRAVVTAVILIAISGAARAERPYVHPVIPERGAIGDLAARIERATEWDIFFSPGYAEAKILGRRVLVEGTVTNTSDHLYEGVEIAFSARDIFGAVLGLCSSKTSPGDLPPGESGSFRCAVDVPIARDLSEITYEVRGLKRSSPD